MANVNISQEFSKTNSITWYVYIELPAIVSFVQNNHNQIVEVWSLFQNSTKIS